MFWLKVAEYIIQALIFLHGHKQILALVQKHAPLKETIENDPTPAQSRNPNLTNHEGGL